MGRAAILALPRAHSSAGERPLHTREVAGSIPAAPIRSATAAREAGLVHLSLINRQRAGGRDPRSRPGKLEHPLRRVRPAPAAARLGSPLRVDPAAGARAWSSTTPTSCSPVRWTRSRRSRGAREQPSARSASRPDRVVRALGARHGRAVDTGDQLAGPACRRALRGDRRARRRRPPSRDDRARARPDLLGAEARLALRTPTPALREPCGGGRAAVRRHRLLARLAPLAAGPAHVTEPSNACRSLLVDLETLGAGTRACSTCSGCPRRCCPRSARPTIPALDVGRGGRVRGADRGDARRPAGGALRPGLHRRRGMAALTLGTGAFLLAERRRRAAGAAGRACWRRRPGTRPARARPTRWRRSARTPATRWACSRRLGFAAPTAARGARLVAARIRWSSPAPAGLGTPHWHGADRITVLGCEQRDDAGRPGGGRPRRRRPPDRRRARGRRAAARRTSCGSAAGSPRTRGCCRPWPTSPGCRSRSPADPEATARGRRRARRARRRPARTRPRRRAGDRAHRRARASTTRGRARERSRWADALEVHVRARGVTRRRAQPEGTGGGGRAARAGAARRPRRSAAGSPASASRSTRPRAACRSGWSRPATWRRERPAGRAS